MSVPVSVVAIVKDSERFVVLYDDESIATALQQIGKWAADKTLPGFTWYDAAAMSRKVRKLSEKKASRF